MSNQVDAIKLNSMLADKQAADNRLKKALKHRSFYSEQIDGKEDSGLFSERIVSVVKKGNPTTRLLEYVEQVKEANRALLEYAPEYFDSSSNFFKEPTVINNVRRVHITTNKAVSSHKITGERLVKRLESFIRTSRKKLLNELTEDEQINTHQQIEQAIKEIEFYKNNLDKEFRRRGQAHNDIVAIYNLFISSNEKTGKQTAHKAHVTAGGMILVRHTSCKDSDVIYSDQGAENFSVYDEANGFKCVLYPTATMYDESEIELLREARRKQKNG